MIDETQTFNNFGYRSTELSLKSGKMIVAICNNCGKVRIVKKCNYYDLCLSCAITGRTVSLETRQKISASKTGVSGGQKSKKKGEKMTVSEKKAWNDRQKVLWDERQNN